MKTPLTMNRFDDWFLPGTSNDSRLFHADDSDHIWGCAPDAGQASEAVGGGDVPPAPVGATGAGG
ncbi:MAG: hypothetical protein AAF959_30290, partial [Cyanobacteria bacterium P01_D01_bin.56]